MSNNNDRKRSLSEIDDKLNGNSDIADESSKLLQPPVKKIKINSDTDIKENNINNNDEIVEASKLHSEKPITNTNSIVENKNNTKKTDNTKNKKSKSKKIISKSKTKIVTPPPYAPVKLIYELKYLMSNIASMFVMVIALVIQPSSKRSLSGLSGSPSYAVLIDSCGEKIKINAWDKGTIKLKALRELECYELGCFTIKPNTIKPIYCDKVLVVNHNTRFRRLKKGDIGYQTLSAIKNKGWNFMSLSIANQQPDDTVADLIGKVVAISNPRVIKGSNKNNISRYYKDIILMDDSGIITIRLWQNDPIKQIPLYKIIAFSHVRKGSYNGVAFSSPGFVDIEPNCSEKLLLEEYFKDKSHKNIQNLLDNYKQEELNSIKKTVPEIQKMVDDFKITQEHEECLFALENVQIVDIECDRLTYSKFDGTLVHRTPLIITDTDSELFINIISFGETSEKFLHLTAAQLIKLQESKKSQFVSTIGKLMKKNVRWTMKIVSSINVNPNNNRKNLQFILRDIFRYHNQEPEDGYYDIEQVGTIDVQDDTEEDDNNTAVNSNNIEDENVINNNQVENKLKSLDIKDNEELIVITDPDDNVEMLDTQ